MQRPARLPLLLTIAVLATALSIPALAAPKPIFKSKLVTSSTKGHAVDVDVDISGAKELYLVVSDGGNGYSCDWADWAEPRLVNGDKVLKLTELKWKSAKAGWGKVRINQNADGGPLMIAGKPVEYGIGTHANSVIAFKLPPGYKRFQARAGLDNGGTSQGGGQSTSVQFFVYTQKPPLAVASRSSGGGGGGLEPVEALERLDVAEGLEAQLFSAEPMILSPSNIDVDHLGRVWVCEIVNYRHRQGSRPEGDRIVILEDTDQDGKADKHTVFYQGRDIDSALGIGVLGNKVIVSVAPNVFIFTDENGDGKADKKEVFFSKVGQPQHDHSTHAFIFGPDGKLYWNVGNTGRHVHDKDGNIIIDKAGNEVRADGKPYRDGMPFRCNTDGSEFEVLGWNFRNNYEVTVDSFGNLWQSDNDDDGNRGVRINFVMEFGNYGYRDEMTGAGWKSPRTGMHPEVPKRHWHLNDPGVVPNLLQTGAGSPTGICVYEGELLPKVFQGQVIHCDAGPNVVRAYPVTKDGAGYEARIENVIDGSRDKWFRPSDVCVAPDGSLIVADWYDPGVGGHRMGDINRGRIFRVAPPDTPYNVPKYDYKTVEGAIAALQNPNLSVRYLAWTSLHDKQSKAEPALLELWKSDNPRYRARALWLLGKIDGRGEHYVNLALKDDNPDIRQVGLRLARQLNYDIIPYVKKVLRDPSPAVRRECAIALRHVESPEAANVWAELAAQHDGEDRWYLEALGIGAHNKSDEAFAAWQKKVGDKWNTPAGRDIVWRSRAKAALPLLAEIIKDPETDDKENLRYFRAFDFHQDPSKNEVLLSLLFVDHPHQDQIRALALERLGSLNLSKNPKLRKAVEQVASNSKDPNELIELINRFQLKDRYPQLLDIAQQHPEDQVGVEAIRSLLARDQKLIEGALANKDLEAAVNTAKVLGVSGDGRITKLLFPVMKDAKKPRELRAEAAKSLAKIKNGAQQILKLAESNQLDPVAKQAAAFELHRSNWNDLKPQIEKLFPLPASKDNKPLPPVSQLLKMKGDVKRGKLVFDKTGTCAKCHVVNNEGKEVGPNLSEIGSKLSKEAFYESILYPSAGISHNYETYAIATTSGNVLTGVIVSQTPDSITIKGADAIARKLKKSEIDEMAKQKVSLMPADLQKTMTAQDLADVVEYLMTLKKKK